MDSVITPFQQLQISTASTPAASTTAVTTSTTPRAEEGSKRKEIAASPLPIVVAADASAFKVKFGPVGAELADALRLFSLDVVGLVAEYAKTHTFDPKNDLIPVDQEIRAKFNALNEKGVLSHKRKGWAGKLCDETGTSILQRGNYGYYSNVKEIHCLKGLYYDDKKPDLVLEISSNGRGWGSAPIILSSTYIILSQEALDAFMRANNLA